MDQPAQTMRYMIAGYVVIFGALFGYLTSLMLRWRRLKQQQKMLDEE